MNKKTFLYLPAVLLLASCGSGEVTTDAPADNDSAAVVEIQYGPLKTSEEVREETVYKHIADVDAVADKSTVIRFVSEDYNQPFPASILDCYNLQVLATTNMTDAELTSEISKFKNLTTLVLTNAAITALPESVGELQNLKVVSLEGCKSLDLEQAIGVLKNCPNLEQLHIGNMGLAEIPASIGELTNLEQVNLGNNTFVKLPDSFYALQKIENLTLSNSTTVDWADFFSRAKAFPALKTLSLQYCGLTTLPADLKDYPVLATVRWRETWDGKDADAIIALCEKENKKFPNLSVTWDDMSALYYDRY
jgi:hypothetical protein